MAKEPKELLFADNATLEMLKRSEVDHIDTVWDRYDAVQPQCKFGSLGVCCRICSMGPCRISLTPGREPQTGACGANVDTIAARSIHRCCCGVSGFFTTDAGNSRDTDWFILTVPEGGVVEVIALGVPTGLGEPVFSKLDGELGRMLGIGAVKGVEVGAGFAVKDMTGIQSNDAMRCEGGKVEFLSNQAGGITGGLSTGQAITVFHDMIGRGWGLAELGGLLAGLAVWFAVLLALAVWRLRRLVFAA